MDVLRLAASALLALGEADFEDIYALVCVAARELGARAPGREEVRAALEELARRGAAARCEEMLHDLSGSAGERYVATERAREVAARLPPGAARLLEMRYVTPSFYHLVRFGAARGRRRAAARAR